MEEMKNHTEETATTMMVDQSELLRVVEHHRSKGQKEGLIKGGIIGGVVGFLGGMTFANYMNDDEIYEIEFDD